MPDSRMAMAQRINTMAGATLPTDKAFVGIVLLTGFGYLLTEILKRIENSVETWRPGI